MSDGCGDLKDNQTPAPEKLGSKTSQQAQGLSFFLSQRRLKRGIHEKARRFLPTG